MRLVNKLALVIFAAMAVILAAVGWLRFHSEVDMVETSTERDNARLTRLMAVAVEHVWEHGGELAVDHMIEAADTGMPSFDVDWVVSPDQPPVGNETNPRPVQSTRHHDGRLVASAATVAPGMPPSRIVLVRNDDVSAGLRRRGFWYPLLLTVALAFTVLLVAVVAGRALVGRPMAGLVAQARRIGSGDLSSRLQMERADEIGALADEMDRMCDQLEEARRRLEAESGARVEAVVAMRHLDRLRTVGQLASGMAHELGSPLAVIQTRAHLIRTGEAGAEEVASAAVIEKQVGKMTRIIRQLLDFARRTTTGGQHVDLRVVIDSARSLVAPLAEQAEVAIDIDTGDQACEVVGDAAQLEQVVTNLAVNGIQAMPTGGKLSIQLDCGREIPAAGEVSAAPHHCITVRDHGAGIRGEHLERIFEPFFTTKRVGEGTGLGLSVAYGIVQEHGGWIDVKSEPGQGSCFHVFLPAVTAAAVAATTPREERAS